MMISAVLVQLLTEMLTATLMTLTSYSVMIPSTAMMHIMTMPMMALIESSMLMIHPLMPYDHVIGARYCVVDHYHHDWFRC